MGAKRRPSRYERKVAAKTGELVQRANILYANQQRTREGFVTESGVALVGVYKVYEGYRLSRNRHMLAAISMQYGGGEMGLFIPPYSKREDLIKLVYRQDGSLGDGATHVMTEESADALRGHELRRIKGILTAMGEGILTRITIQAEPIPIDGIIRP